MRINCYVYKRVMMKYLLCILSLAFLLIGGVVWPIRKMLRDFGKRS